MKNDARLIVFQPNDGCDLLFPFRRCVSRQRRRAVSVYLFFNFALGLEFPGQCLRSVRHAAVIIVGQQTSGGFAQSAQRRAGRVHRYGPKTRNDTPFETL